MENKTYQNWRVVSTVQLGASAEEVWKLVGGFYILPQWHPDITLSEVPEKQPDEKEIRRVLTFPGQAPTVEQLVFMDNENFHYRYKWHAGPWGEQVQQYKAEIKILELDASGNSCVVQWSSTFWYFEDALTQFYKNGFDNLLKIFGPATHTNQP
ncbi:SRPBCC family protein [Mucilaginibacter sp.]|jgi:hypothetical protein|uniref:SRPBCC family protein n=1 Tax=Mucilaginibacter sp. TaxID=1882438 RepID=UPI003566B5DE